MIIGKETKGEEEGLAEERREKEGKVVGEGDRRQEERRRSEWRRGGTKRWQ